MLSDVISQFSLAIKKAGLECQDTIIADGKLHRFKVIGDNHSNSWYVLYDGELPAGAFGCWKRGVSEKWCSKPNKSFLADHKAYEARIEAAKKIYLEEQSRIHEKARKEANEIWDKSLFVITDHPYLLRKKVKPYGIKIKDEILIIPLYNSKKEIQSLQYILPNGNKRFLEDGAITGNYYSIGELTDKIFICEGYATGAAIHEAAGCNVVIAFSASNLLPVTQIIKDKYPDRNIMICADNDCHGEDGKNIGVKTAAETSKKVGVGLIIPKFKDITTKPTDFNDLMILEGIDEVRIQLSNACNASETSEEVVERLSKLSLIEYAQIRKQEAEKLGIGIGFLDTAVRGYKQLLSENSNNKNELISGIKDWEYEVEGTLIADKIQSLIGDHIVLSGHQITALVLWVFGTYCIDAFGIFPKLLITSPDKRCGKTTLLSLLRSIVNKALMSSNITPSAIFRSVELWKPTLLIDEADTFLNNDNTDLRCIINSGHTKDTAYVLRTEGDSSNRYPKQFSTWTPMAISMIKNPPNTILDRSISIMLQRKLASELITKWNFDNFLKLESLRRKVKKWVSDNFEVVKNCQVNVPNNSNDRATDNWAPLFTIAHAIGAEWPGKAEAAFRSINNTYNGNDRNFTIMLLMDIKKIFAKNSLDKIHSCDLVAKMIELEERPWGEYKDGRSITSNTLAKMLGYFGIRSKQVWKDGCNKHGYELADFENTFSRYLS